MFHFFFHKSAYSNRFLLQIYSSGDAETQSRSLLFG